MLLVHKCVHAHVYTEVLEVPEGLLRHKANSVKQTVCVKKLCVPSQVNCTFRLVGKAMHSVMMFFRHLPYLCKVLG